MPRRRRLFRFSSLRSASGSKSTSSSSETPPNSPSPSSAYVLGGTGRNLLLLMDLLGVVKISLTSSGTLLKSDSSVSSPSSESDRESDRRLRFLIDIAAVLKVVLEGARRLLLALPFSIGVAKMGAPGAIPFGQLSNLHQTLFDCARSRTSFVWFSSCW
jgi:hypothetical protein